MDLERFGEGKLLKMIREGIGEILENIARPETSPVAKRVLTIKVTFRPSKDRKNIKVQVETRINKAPIRTKESNMFVGEDMNGNPVFYTANEQIPGQLCVENVEGG